MFLSILFFLISLIPTTLLLIWMFKRRPKDNVAYKKMSIRSLVGGLISILPILGISALFHVLNRLIFKDVPVLLYQGIYNFVVLALSEEIVKFVVLLIVLKKKKEEFSSSDIVAFMVIIGATFGLVEDIPYAIGADPMTMLIRGLTMGHVGYGFIMGYFYAKGVKKNNVFYKIVGFVLPWLLHGLYDFSLAKELIELNDAFMMIAFSLAVLDIVLLIILSVYFIKDYKKRKIVEAPVENKIDNQLEK